MSEFRREPPRPRHMDTQSRASGQARLLAAAGQPAARDRQIATPLALMQRKLNSAPQVRQLHALAEGLSGRDGVVQRVSVSKTQDTATSTFSINMDEAASQILGTPTMNTAIEFTLKPAYPDDANPIVLDQIVRASNAESGALTSWEGGEERRRQNLMTAADADGGVEGGWFMDHLSKNYLPRTDTAKPEVPTDYISSSVTEESKMGVVGMGRNVPGKKVGADIVAAKMFDAPASPEPYDFKAEVVAKGKQNQQFVPYDTLEWGFTTGKAAPPKIGLDVKGAYARFAGAPSPTYRAALAKFNDIYHNAASETSPENIHRLVDEIKGLAGSQDGDAAARSAALRAELNGIFQKIGREEHESDFLRHEVAKFTAMQQIQTQIPAPREQEQHTGEEKKGDSGDEFGFGEFTSPGDANQGELFGDFADFSQFTPFVSAGDMNRSVPSEESDWEPVWPDMSNPQTTGGTTETIEEAGNES
jgi:hypothetical protein